MESLFFLIPFGLIFIAIAVKVLFWAINSGQYDNLDSEAHRILFDDVEAAQNKDKAIPTSDLNNKTENKTEDD